MGKEIIEKILEKLLINEYEVIEVDTIHIIKNDKNKIYIKHLLNLLNSCGTFNGNKIKLYKNQFLNIKEIKTIEKKTIEIPCENYFTIEEEKIIYEIQIINKELKEYIAC